MVFNEKVFPWLIHGSQSAISQQLVLSQPLRVHTSLQPMQRVHPMQSGQLAQPEESVHTTLVQLEPSQPSLSPVQSSLLEESALQTTSIVTHSSVQMSPAPPSDALNCEPLMEPESSLLPAPNNEELNRVQEENKTVEILEMSDAS
ncbi:hypothetical protein V6N11_071372 [Hibiscus sabdariffa]|uniref:Uncharacterized protein n=1 Tax=Hibiscus sabdariffa TaxID=183260 RepID=A0ABR2TZY8_9ROSI